MIHSSANLIDGVPVEVIRKRIRCINIRVKVSPNQYRLFYCYVEPDSVLVLFGFVKKTRQTPKHEIEKAKQIRKAVLK